VVKKKVDLSNYKLALPVFFLLIAFTGSALIAKTTAWGPWAFSDSAAYISSARNFNLGLGVSLRNAEGILKPLDIFPPIYPLALSILARLGMDYFSSARWLDVILFGLFLLIYTWGIHALTGNFWVTLISAVLVLFSPVMIENFSGAMTEPLFITIFYSAVFATLLYLQKKKNGWFLLAVLLTGISPLMRYIGLVTCTVNALILLMLDDSSWKVRFKKSAAFGAISLLPILSWFAITFTTNQTLGARTIIFSSDLSGKLQTFLTRISSVFQSWVPYAGYRIDWMPDSAKTVLLLTALLTVLILGFLLHVKQKKDLLKSSTKYIHLLITTILVIFIFLMALCLIYLFTLPQPDIISRMITPILPAIVLLAVTGSFFLLKQLPIRWKPFANIFFAVLTLLVIRYFFLFTNSFIKERSVNGYGYTAREIQTSDFIQAIQKIPASTPLIATTPALTLLYTNRMPYPLDFIPTASFGTRALEVDQIFATRQAALILDYASIRNVYPDWQERLTYFTRDLDTVYQDDIGGIYYFPLKN
jgi:hypothetical protein